MDVFITIAVSFKHLLKVKVINDQMALDFKRKAMVVVV